MRRWFIIRRKKPSQGVTEARAERERQQCLLDETVKTRKTEDREVVQPLKHERHRINTQNHVTEEIVRLLRGNA